MLDVDEPCTIVPALQQLLDPPAVWSRLHQDIKADCTLFHELAHEPEFVKTPLVSELRAAADRIIRSEYTSVAAYHACRPTDRSSYTERGLLRTNRELLLSLAREAFGQVPNLEVTFDPVCREYLQGSDGTVWLFLSAHERTSWYTTGCFLGKMAAALGQDGQRVLTAFLARATPTVVKCVLPLDWLDLRMREPSVGQYVIAALQKMVLVRASPETATHSFGSLGLKCDVPPEMIIGFMDPPRGWNRGWATSGW